MNDYASSGVDGSKTLYRTHARTLALAAGAAGTASEGEDEGCFCVVGRSRGLRSRVLEEKDEEEEEGSLLVPAAGEAAPALRGGLRMDVCI
jgi:hypothetical protein